MENKGKAINSGDGSMVDTTASDHNKTRASMVSRDSHSRSIAAIITGNKDRQSLHQALFGLLPQKPSKADETINTTKFGSETVDGDTSQLNLTALHNMSNNSNDRTPPTSVNQPLRKQAVVKFSFNDIKDKLTKIDNRDIGSLVRDRFLGTNLVMDDSDNLDKTEQTVKLELPKNTIVQFIEKFGFVELNEVDNILMADNNKSYQAEAVMLTPEQEPDKPYSHLSVDPQGEDPEAAFLEMPSMALPEKTSWKAEKKKESVQFYDREPFSYGGERLIDSHFYLEDISDEPILETEIMNTINMLLDGQHSSIVCSYAISKQNHRTAIFGTETGEIIECIPGDQKNQVKKHSLDAKVTALALSPEDEYFVAGSNSSELLVKKTVGKMAKKYIKNLNQQKICQIVFSGTSSFIVSTILNVYHFSIVSYSLLLEVNMTAVVPRQPFVIMQLAPLDFEGVLRILVAMNDRVSLYALVKDEGRKESHVYKVGTDIEDAAVNIAPQNNKWPPSVQWIKPSPTTAVPCFIVFWKTKIMLVEFHSTEYMISALREIPTYCVWGTLLDSRLLCMINSQLEVELLSLERIFAPDYQKTTTHCKFPIFEGVFKDQRDIGYMTKYKDKLEEEELDLSMKLPFFQFFRNRIKEMDETIYMITDKGLMRYKLTSIEKLIDVYMIKNRHTAAIKMINNVFLGTVFVKDVEKSSIQELAPQVVDSYMRQKMKDDLLVEDQAKLIDTAIECLVCSDNTEAVFDVVKSKFTPKLFWGEVSKFIREKIITNIPYDELANGAQYLDNEEVIELLTEFRIEATEDDDQIINRVLMIIKKKNIWPFLYKFCVFYPSQSIPTFLTMLAAEILTMDKNVRDIILDEAIFQSTDETDIDQYFEEPNRRLFFRLFWFFNLALSTGVLEKSLLHFTDEPETIERNIPDIYAKTLEWLLDSNNANIIIQTSSQMFFELILSCVLNIRLLKCPRVIEVIKKIKNVYLKKNQPVNDLRFVANFRATENLNFDPHPFTIAENILMILEDLLDGRYKRDIAFVAIKLLCFATHDRRFENQEWICYELITLVSEPFQHGRFWLDYRPIAQDKFEDLIIVGSDNLENIKSIEAMQKQITNMAFEMK